MSVNDEKARALKEEEEEGGGRGKKMSRRRTERGKVKRAGANSLL